MTKEPTAAQTVEKVAAEAVRLMHAQDRWMTDLGEAAYAIRYELNGRILGLRWVLCVLKGWNPVGESGKEERADRFLRIWHNMPGHCGEKDCGAW